MYCQGRLTEAIPIFERAFQTRKEVLGVSNADTITVLLYYADVLYDNGDLDLSLKYYEELLQYQQDYIGTDSPDASNTILKQADIYLEQGNTLKACELQCVALHKRISFYGKKHLVTAESYTSVALLLDIQGLYINAMGKLLLLLCIFISNICHHVIIIQYI